MGAREFQVTDKLKQPCRALPGAVPERVSAAAVRRPLLGSVAGISAGECVRQFGPSSPGAPPHGGDGQDQDDRCQLQLFQRNYLFFQFGLLGAAGLHRVVENTTGPIFRSGWGM